MAQGAALERPEIRAIAAKHNKSTAQVLLRWGLQIGNIILPKSLTESRIKANADIFDFELDADDMEVLNGLDEGMKMESLDLLELLNLLLQVLPDLDQERDPNQEEYQVES